MSMSLHPPSEDGALLVHPVRLLPDLPWPDISFRAKWSVSSFKFGFGAECLLDGDPDTFWQYAPTLSVHVRAIYTPPALTGHNRTS